MSAPFEVTSRHYSRQMHGEACATFHRNFQVVEDVRCADPFNSIVPDPALSFFSVVNLNQVTAPAAPSLSWQRASRAYR